MPLALAEKIQHDSNCLRQAPALRRFFRDVFCRMKNAGGACLALRCAIPYVLMETTLKWTILVPLNRSELSLTTSYPQKSPKFPRFLSRSAMLERDVVIGGALRPSVRPSNKPVPYEDMLIYIYTFSPSDSPLILVFLTPTSTPWFQGNSPGNSAQTPYIMHEVTDNGRTSDVMTYFYCCF